jgi:hypothetical protein
MDKTKKQYGEEDVGIARFLSEGLTALPSAIKHRYSDFIVNEIDKKGEVTWFKSELENQTRWKSENIKETLPESVLDKIRTAEAEKEVEGCEDIVPPKDVID